MKNMTWCITQQAKKRKENQYMALKCGLSYTIDGIERKYVNNMESIVRFRYFGLQNKVIFSPLKRTGTIEDDIPDSAYLWFYIWLPEKGMRSV